MAQMDDVTQSNAAIAEETAAAGEELTAQARDLDVAMRSMLVVVEGRGRAARESKKSAYALVTEGGSDVRRPVVQQATYGGARGNGRGLVPEQVIPLEAGDFEDF